MSEVPRFVFDETSRQVKRPLDRPPIASFLQRISLTWVQHRLAQMEYLSFPLSVLHEPIGSPASQAAILDVTCQFFI